jgi:CubicO group peptidase (beta-lactamase class C family)
MLNIDNTVITYLPAYAFDPRITLRMLLNHTAGLDDYVNNPVQFPPPPGWVNGVTQQYVLTAIAAAPLLFVPGSAFEYSNSGYFILGSIIEAVTGTSYADYLATNILQPVGLSHTSYLQPLTAAQPYSYANPLVPGTTGLAIGIIPHPSVYFASGALWSSVQDLAVWDAALRNGTVIPATMFTQMITPPASVPIYRQAGSQTEYAMGWLRTTFLGRPIVAHGGQSLAYTSFNGMYLDSSFTVTVLTNVDIQGSAGDLDDFSATLIQRICTTPSTASSC